MDEFLENLQTAFVPAPFMGKYIAIFPEIHDKLVAPAPFEIFPKIHPFWRKEASLKHHCHHQFIFDPSLKHHWHHF